MTLQNKLKIDRKASARVSEGSGKNAGSVDIPGAYIPASFSYISENPEIMALRLQKKYLLFINGSFVIETEDRKEFESFFKD